MKTGVLDFVRQHRVLTGLVVLAVIFAGWWRYEFPSATWRYKITVEVETPEGLKTGSAVREVRAWKNVARFLNPDVRPVTYEVMGEAVVVDLGKRGVLFGLMNEFTYQEVHNAMLENRSPDAMYYKNLKIGKKTELKKDAPAFVIFSDLNNPKSSKGCGVPIMESVLGQGVKLKRIMVEITDVPVTRQIEKWLPWLPQYKGHTGYLSGEQSHHLTIRQERT
jgi:hypothetical protein